jgi:hypothetical protein
MKIVLQNRNVVNSDATKVDSYTVFRAFFNNVKEYSQLLSILQQVESEIQKAMESGITHRKLELRVNKDEPPKLKKSAKKVVI